VLFDQRGCGRSVPHASSPDTDLASNTTSHLVADIELLRQQLDIGILVNGRFDFQSPIANAWELKGVWPRAELVIVDDAGHDAGNSRITQELIHATDRFASLR
jgi:proline iminopeptidase